LVENNPPINPQAEPVSAGVDASGIDVQQLLGYLADPRTVSLSSLRYVLNAKKMDPNDQANATNLARKKMQLVFKNNAKLIWDARPSFFSNYELNNIKITKDTFKDFLNSITENHPIFSFVITN
jgi:hypothetical protein